MDWEGRRSRGVLLVRQEGQGARAGSLPLSFFPTYHRSVSCQLGGCGMGVPGTGAPPAGDEKDEFHIILGIRS